MCARSGRKRVSCSPYQSEALEQILQADFKLLDQLTAPDGKPDNSTATLEKCRLLAVPRGGRRVIVDQRDAVLDFFPRVLARTPRENGHDLQVFSVVVELIDDSTSVKYFRSCPSRIPFEIKRVVQPVDGDGKPLENVRANRSRVLVPRCLAIAQIRNHVMHATSLNAHGLDPSDPPRGIVSSCPLSKDSVIAVRDMLQNLKLLHERLVDTESSEIPSVDYKVVLSTAANAGFDDNLRRI